MNPDQKLVTPKNILNNPALVLNCARFAAAVYLPIAKQVQFLKDNGLMTENGGEWNLWLVDGHNKIELAAAYINSNQSLVVVAIRGLDSLSIRLYELKEIKTLAEGIETFLLERNASSTLIQLWWPNLKDFLEKVECYCKIRFGFLGRYSIFLTGHSLGAAAAEYCTLKLKDEIPCITFESTGFNLSQLDIPISKDVMKQRRSAIASYLTVPNLLNCYEPHEYIDYTFILGNDKQDRPQNIEFILKVINDPAGRNILQLMNQASMVNYLDIVNVLSNSKVGTAFQTMHTISTHPISRILDVLKRLNFNGNLQLPLIKTAIWPNFHAYQEGHNNKRACDKWLKESNGLRFFLPKNNRESKQSEFYFLNSKILVVIIVGLLLFRIFYGGNSADYLLFFIPVLLLVDKLFPLQHYNSRYTSESREHITRCSNIWRLFAFPLNIALIPLFLLITQLTSSESSRARWEQLVVLVVVSMWSTMRIGLTRHGILNDILVGAFSYFALTYLSNHFFPKEVEQNDIVNINNNNIANIVDTKVQQLPQQHSAFTSQLNESKCSVPTLVSSNVIPSFFNSTSNALSVSSSNSITDITFTKKYVSSQINTSVTTNSFDGSCIRTIQTRSTPSLISSSSSALFFSPIATNNNNHELEGYDDGITLHSTNNSIFSSQSRTTIDSKTNYLTFSSNMVDH
jgi:hypothetical protein